jgi:predicted nucleotidyltransferase component of viral defense system
MQELPNLDSLLTNTRTVLQELIQTAPFLQNFVLVGGSALALHISHRQSEDLDFFTYQDVFNKTAILDYIKCFPHREIINNSPQQLDLLLNGVKVTFFNARWDFLAPNQIQSFNLASLKAIAGMKTNALFVRAKYRDYYDLYCLAQNGMALNDIFNAGQVILEGINFKLFCIALTYIDDIEDDNIDHLQPRERVSKQAIRTYFEKQLVDTEMSGKR